MSCATARRANRRLDDVEDRLTRIENAIVLTQMEPFDRLHPLDRLSLLLRQLELPLGRVDEIAAELSKAGRI